LSLEHVRRTYERWGREDPFHAVITSDEYRGGGGDVEAFFRSGREEVAGVLAYLEGLGVEVSRGRALDFGCGVGRLSQALAEHFDGVVGVDISASMVEKAEELDRRPGKVRYVVNTADDLAVFEDASFDLVYTRLTLQHMPPRYVRRYVREFFRVLRPGGVAVFQMRSGRRIRPGSLSALLYRLNREHFRRLLQRLRGRPPYEIHYLAREDVEEVIEAAGGTVVDVVDVSGRGRPGSSYRYAAVRTRDGTPEPSAP